MIHLSIHITEYFKAHFEGLSHLSRDSAAGRSFWLCVTGSAVAFNGTIEFTQHQEYLKVTLSHAMCHRQDAQRPPGHGGFFQEYKHLFCRAGCDSKHEQNLFYYCENLK